ncbi:CocE/NonD family hydrolase [Streptomyces sp. NPDC090994]|uniref:CocE/NonD family hydrolase n=1 Tax=Streptomyces sp. NPDC090994 TaxID=3365969 RepID=UPI00382E89B1
MNTATPTTRVIIDHDVPMPARDGVVLRANVYRPQGEGPWPVIMTRLPYGKDNPPTMGFHPLFLDPVTAARRGFIVVVQDVRGVNASDGVFRPFRDEYDDGARAVSWAATLPGANGKVGLYGGSYFGFTAMAAAAASDQVAAIIPRMRTADPLNGMHYRQGAFELTSIVGWFLRMGVGEAARRYADDPARFREVAARFVAASDALYEDGYRHRPLNRFAPMRDMPLAEGFFFPLDHPMDAEALDYLDFSKKMDRITAPAMHVGGWYDLFLQTTLDDFTAMRARGVPTRLVVGPGTHGGPTTDPVGERTFGAAAGDLALNLTDNMTDMQLRWMERWLRNDGEPVRDEPDIQVFVMGENRWRALPGWPPAHTPTELFLAADGVLAPEAPAAEGVRTYVYDPQDPVPTLGGATMSDPSHPAGAFDQRPVESRPDVLTFTTPPLEDDLPVIGRLTAHVWAASDAVDTDFVVRICDVFPDGRSFNITDGVVRAHYREAHRGAAPSPIEPGTPYAYEIDLWSTANVFRRGHRIRVHVTSSNFPRWDANPNTGDALGADRTRAAHQHVLFGPAHPSRIVLPVADLTRTAPLGGEA